MCCQFCVASSWIPPTCGGNPDTEYYPFYPYRNDTTQNYFQHYQLGIGASHGSCCKQFDPPAGFWCSNETQGGGAFTYRTPSGLVFDKTILPNSPYNDPIGAVIQTWR